MPTFLVLVVAGSIPAQIPGAIPAPGRVFVYVQQGAYQPMVAQVPKRCPCGPSCVCGCNQGLPCSCITGPVQRLPQGPAVQMYYPPVYQSPVRQPVAQAAPVRVCGPFGCR